MNSIAAKSKYLLLFTCLFLFFPTISVAHEVYVLTPEAISDLEELPPVSFTDIFMANANETILWGIVVAFLIFTIFFISISVKLEKRIDPTLVRLKKYAPFVARVTAGLAFISCGYHMALFGPELPFETLYGSWSGIVQMIFYIIGFVMLVGLYSRTAGLIGLIFFVTGIVQYGSYMTTYTNYLAELLLLILVGGHRYVIAEEESIWSKPKSFFNYLTKQYGEFSFLILRVGFGISLIYAAVYAKILHNQLAIAVVQDFDLVTVFGFSAEFIVFGAAIIEILLGIFFILGLEIRFTAIVLNVFLTLSLFYFGEAVWPHIILIGIPIAFFCYGYDKYSLEGFFFKKGNREPIF